MELHKKGKLAIILIIVRRSKQSAAVDGLKAGLGVLVDVLLEGEELYIRHLRLVSVLLKDGYSDKHPNVPWTTGEVEEKAAVPTMGKFLLSNQS